MRRARGSRATPLANLSREEREELQVMAHDLARWTSRIGLGEALVTTKTLRRRLFGLPGRLARSARRLLLHLPRHWPWADRFGTALIRLRASRR